MPKKAKKPGKKRGPKPQRFKLPGDDWQGNLATMLKKKKPASGWPK